MAITRKDVARMAGVSTATVSNVLNNSDKVKEETANHVRKIIKLFSQYGSEKPFDQKNHAGGYCPGGYFKSFLC